MSVEKALDELKAQLNDRESRIPISFDNFLTIVSEQPNNVFRNIFQLFSDMIKYYIGEGEDEYPNDPESINFVRYDCSKLFVEDSDTPFLADRLFANRLVNLARSFRSGAQRNKLIIFEGPTGSGKSTFLNNLLSKLEDYTNTPEGLTYEIIWKIDRKLLSGFRREDEMESGYSNIIEIAKNNHLLDETINNKKLLDDMKRFLSSSETLDIPCPSHDNPLLIIPKKYRHDFIDKIVTDKEYKEMIFNKKEYEWILKDEPCTICTSLYQTFRDKFNSPSEVFKMAFARKYRLDRRLGEGISVYNPGDDMMKMPLTNDILQSILNNVLRDSNAVRYVFSQLARTNNGIYAIMDIKSHNKDRIMNLHGIISDSVHKVEHIEENIESLFIALMNPEDKDVIESVKSLGDRILRIPISYVLEYQTEVEIYRHKFGIEIEKLFLPRVLENFAKVVISTRLNKKSDAMAKWIKEPNKYEKYCDKDLLLLKMDIYTGIIPGWLSEEDVKSFDAITRRNIIGESELEGQDEISISGRKSIELFNEFISKYRNDNILIDMAKVAHFFTNTPGVSAKVPEGFLNSLITLYDYTVLQELKESLYYYNKDEIINDILNYLFAINFEIGNIVKCIYTDKKIEISEEFFKRIEDRIISDVGEGDRKKFRNDIQKEYTSKTLSHDMGVEGMDIRETSLFLSLIEKYQRNLKEDVLNPFLENDNFRNAIKDYNLQTFKTYDNRIKRDVRYLINNLKKKYTYTEDGAKQICVYIMDNNIPQKFSKK